MNTKLISQEVTLPNKKVLSLSTGLLAKQAHGAVEVSIGNTRLLATVVAKEKEESASFLPLTVDYQEKFSAIGKIPGGFFRRESKPDEHEIVTARLVDRGVRPLLGKDYKTEIQVSITLLSSDHATETDTYALLAASAALNISHLPFDGPVASVRVVKRNGELLLNPSAQERSEATLDMIIAGTEKHILMLEGKSREVQEEELAQVIKFAQEAIKVECQVQEQLAAQLKNTKEKGKDIEEVVEPFIADLSTRLYNAFYKVAEEQLAEKQARKKAFSAAEEKVLATLPEEIVAAHQSAIGTAIADAQRNAIRDYTLKGCRIDGREHKKIRPISIAVNYLPQAHGSALFTRGDTQVLATTTLGSKLDAQSLNGVSVRGEKSFIFNYNFPSFATGEVKPNRGPSRREIGHGNLALNALKPVLPIGLPYTLRVTADTLSSDGSSSMASICSGSISLIDAGIQIKRPVAGVTVGLITNPENGEEILISDILSEEDACGEVDCKVAGTRDGITAFQMDIKSKGLTFEVLGRIFQQAKEGRNHILDKMEEALNSIKRAPKAHIPVARQFTIKPSLIGSVIGPRGKVIQDLQRETGADISIDDEGNISLFAPTQEAANTAFEAIQNIVGEPEEGKIYKGKIKSIMDYGAFVEFLPGKEGLVHSSEMSDETKELQVGQQTNVKLLSITKPKDKRGRTRFSLSIKQV